jgi:hypothetical protein
MMVAYACLMTTKQSMSRPLTQVQSAYFPKLYHLTAPRCIPLVIMDCDLWMCHDTVLAMGGLPCVPERQYTVHPTSRKSAESVNLVSWML